MHGQEAVQGAASGQDCRLLICLWSLRTSSHSQGKAEQERQTETVRDELQGTVTLQFFILHQKRGKKRKQENNLSASPSMSLSVSFFISFSHSFFLIYAPQQQLHVKPDADGPIPEPRGFCCSLPSTFVSKPTLIPLHCKQMIIISLVFQFRINWLIYTWINCINAMLVIGAWYDLK